MITFLDDHLHGKYPLHGDGHLNTRYKFILSRDIDDQRFLHPIGQEPHLATPKPKMLVCHATSPWWLSSWKNTKMTLDSSERYQWSKNPAIRLDERHYWPHPRKFGSLTCYLLFMTHQVVFWWLKKTKISIDPFQRY